MMSPELKTVSELLLRIFKRLSSKNPIKVPTISQKLPSISSRSKEADFFTSDRDANGLCKAINGKNGDRQKLAGKIRPTQSGIGGVHAVKCRLCDGINSVTAGVKTH